MPDDTQNTKISLSRRKILTATGAIGASGLATGLGSQAFFTDREQFGNNQLVAGELDMKVGWEEHYSDWSEDEAEHAHMEDDELVIDDRQGFMDATLVEQWPDKETKAELDEGTADPCEVLADVPDDLEKPVIELSDVKPGDSGEVTFSFALCDNPGWVWMNGSVLENNENGIVEPEAQAPNEDGNTGPMGGELAEAIQVTIWYDDNCDNLRSGELNVFRGSLAEALQQLSQGRGFLLDGGIGEDIHKECYESEKRHCLGFRWELPADRGNATQSDSVKFDLGFTTEQCRHQPRQTLVQPDKICIYFLVIEKVWVTDHRLGNDWRIKGEIGGSKGRVSGEPIHLPKPGKKKNIEETIAATVRWGCSPHYLYTGFTARELDDAEGATDEGELLVRGQSRFNSFTRPCGPGTVFEDTATIVSLADRFEEEDMIKIRTTKMKVEYRVDAFCIDISEGEDEGVW